MAIGFINGGPRRVTVRNECGVKVGYIAQVNGKQVLQTVEGQKVATILRWKKDYAQSRTGLCGGSWVPEGCW